MIIIKKLFFIIFCTKDIKINLYKLNFLSYFSTTKCQQNNTKKITKSSSIPSLSYPPRFLFPLNQTDLTQWQARVERLRPLFILSSGPAHGHRTNLNPLYIKTSPRVFVQAKPSDTYTDTQSLPLSL